MSIIYLFYNLSTFPRFDFEDNLLNTHTYKPADGLSQID